MANTATTAEAPQADATPTEDKPKRTTYRAESFLDQALDLVKKAGDAGLSVKDLATAIEARVKAEGGTLTNPGHAYRIAHNVGWHLEGMPVYRAADDEHGKVTKPEKRQVRRLPGSQIRYVLGAGEEGKDFTVTKAVVQARKAAARSAA